MGRLEVSGLSAGGTPAAGIWEFLTLTAPVAKWMRLWRNDCSISQINLGGPGASGISVGLGAIFQRNRAVETDLDRGPA